MRTSGHTFSSCQLAADAPVVKVTGARLTEQPLPGLAYRSSARIIARLASGVTPAVNDSAVGRGPDKRKVAMRLEEEFVFRARERWGWATGPSPDFGFSGIPETEALTCPCSRPPVRVAHTAKMATCTSTASLVARSAAPRRGGARRASLAVRASSVQQPSPDQLIFPWRNAVPVTAGQGPPPVMPRSASVARRQCVMAHGTPSAPCTTFTYCLTLRLRFAGMRGDPTDPMALLMQQRIVFLGTQVRIRCLSSSGTTPLVVPGLSAERAARMRSPACLGNCP